MKEMVLGNRIRFLQNVFQVVPKTVANEVVPRGLIRVTPTVKDGSPGEERLQLFDQVG
jgi:hypothetical protein